LIHGSAGLLPKCTGFIPLLVLVILPTLVKSDDPVPDVDHFFTFLWTKSHQNTSDNIIII